MSRDGAYVLAVEDDPDIQMIILLALKFDAGIRAVVVGSGAEALRRFSEEPAPDLVLIDDNLPDMDGVSLLSAMRRTVGGNGRYAFLTASIRDADRARFVAAGAIGVIPKPFNPLTLAREIRVMLDAGAGSVDSGRPAG